MLQVVLNVDVWRNMRKLFFTWIFVKIILQHSHYYTRIARFMPRVEIVQKHNCAARRLSIRGHNGKVSRLLLYLLKYNGIVQSLLRNQITFCSSQVSWAFNFVYNFKGYELVINLLYYNCGLCRSIHTLWWMMPAWQSLDERSAYCNSCACWITSSQNKR